MRNYSGPLTIPVAIILIIVIALLFFAIWGFSKALGADVDCLTKAQARAKWPKDIIYWHTANRCWDNISTRRTGPNPARYSVNRNPLQLGKPMADGNGNGTRHSRRPVVIDPPAGPSVFYPSLMPGRGTDHTMLEPHNMKTWPLIVDFDIDPPLFLPWNERISSTFDKS